MAPRWSIGCATPILACVEPEIAAHSLAPATVRVEPVTLEGRLVRLEPMSLDHLPGLTRAAADERLWHWTPAQLMTEDAVAAWLEAALSNRDAGTELPFVTVEAASGTAIGSSRFMNIALEHRRVEIGWTWVATAWQGSGANREAKLLMLEHAFEQLGCARVEFKTDAKNERSRAALLAIGARFDGVFRKHMIMPDGRVRDSAWYSVIDDDWPAVKAGLVEDPASGTRRRHPGR